MLRTLLASAALALSLPLSALEHSYVANLDGTQEVPPNASPATGFAVVTVEEAGASFRISYQFDNILTGVSSGHIHGPAPAGANAGVLFDLMPPAAVSGEVLDLVFDLTAEQLQQLRDGLWYVNLHSTAFAGGEIRGQLLPEAGFDARLEGAQETPPVVSAASGRGRVTVSADGSLLHVLLGFQNLGSPLTLTHIHGPAERGAAAGVVFDLMPTTGVTMDRYSRFFDIGLADPSQLEDGLWYLNLHTEEFPGGEIRGQLDIISDDGFETEATAGL